MREHSQKKGGPRLSISKPKQLRDVTPAELSSAGANNGVQGRVRPAPAQLDEFIAWLVDPNGRTRFGRPDHGNASGGAGNNFRFNFTNVKGGNTYYILVVQSEDKKGRATRNTRQIVVT